jgi:hypothetical protein
VNEIMASENAQKKPRLLLIGLLILIAIIVIVVLVFGVQGIFKILGTIGIVIIFILFLGLIAWGFYELFIKKHRYDVVYVNKQKLIQAGKMNISTGVMNDLFISGDRTHSRVKIGKIIGYVRIQVLARTNKYDQKGNIIYKSRKNPEEPLEPDYNLDKEEQDIFIIKRNFLQGIFIDPLVIRVSPIDHDDLIGDVTLKGFSLIPISEYLFLNSDYLDVRKIDFAILKEAERGIMFENLRDMKSIVDKAIGLDSSHKKEIEKKDLVEIPEQAR